MPFTTHKGPLGLPPGWHCNLVRTCHLSWGHSWLLHLSRGPSPPQTQDCRRKASLSSSPSASLWLQQTLKVQAATCCPRLTRASGLAAGSTLPPQSHQNAGSERSRINEEKDPRGTGGKTHRTPTSARRAKLRPSHSQGKVQAYTAHPVSLWWAQNRDPPTGVRSRTWPSAFCSSMIFCPCTRASRQPAGMGSLQGGHPGSDQRKLPAPEDKSPTLGPPEERCGQEGACLQLSCMEDLGCTRRCSRRNPGKRSPVEALWSPRQRERPGRRSSWSGRQGLMGDMGQVWGSAAFGGQSVSGEEGASEESRPGGERQGLPGV